MRIETGAARAEVTALGWDTEGTGREKTNLLRPQTMVGLRIRCAGQWRNGINLPTRSEADAGGGKSYWMTVAPETEINWRIRSAGGSLTMQFSGNGANLGKVEGVELVFPVAPGVTPAQADRASGQVSLFGVLGAATEARPRYPEPGEAVGDVKVEEWPERIRLAYEKEALGFYISGHPLHGYEKEARRYASATCAQAAHKRQGDKVAVVGVVTSLRERSNKEKGTRYGFFTVEDLTVSVEVICWGSRPAMNGRPAQKGWADWEEAVGGDEPILVHGEVRINTRDQDHPRAEVVGTHYARAKTQVPPGDVAFLSTYNAQSGASSFVPNLFTCANVSCHGGQAPPSWRTGVIYVTTNCTICHSQGTAQFNSYNSGERSRHSGGSFACTECHDTNVATNNKPGVANNFLFLGTPAMEGPARDTFRNSTGTVVYTPGSTPGNGTCTGTCHGKDHNSENW